MILHAPDEPPLQPVSWVQPQAGCLAYLRDIQPLRVALVTSRRTGRWVFPKGGIDPGMTPTQTARQEAFEEAGLIGQPHARSIGAYRIPKIRPPMIWTIEVALYPMAVDRVLDVWLESAQRVRRFVTIDQACELVDEPEIKEIARAFAAGME